jgi:hypothetical protein
MEVIAPNLPAWDLPGSLLEHRIALIAMVGHNVDRW